MKQILKRFYEAIEIWNKNKSDLFAKKIYSQQKFRLFVICYLQKICIENKINY